MGKTELQGEYKRDSDILVLRMVRTNTDGSRSIDEYVGQPDNVGPEAKRHVVFRYFLSDNRPSSLTAPEYLSRWSGDPKYFAAIAAIFFNVKPVQVQALLPAV